MLPILGDRTTPVRIKAGLSLLIALLVIPFVEKPVEVTEDMLFPGI